MEVFVILGVIIVVSIAYYIDKYNMNKKEDTRQNQEHNAILSITTKHIIGLPLAEQTECRVFLCEDKIVIKNVKNNCIYNLSMNKISDINIKNEQEIQTNYTSSIGGAVGGAVLFGPLGAMIGGRSKKKVDKTIHSYLIFTYNNENKIDYISFDVTSNLKAHRFVDYFSNNCKRNTITDL